MNIKYELFCAVLDGDIDYAKQLMDKGGDIKGITPSEKWTFFHRIFIIPGNKAPIQSIQFLLEQGLDVNAIDSNGSTPLIYAVRQKNVDGIRLLLENGADKLLEHKDNRGISALRMGFSGKPYSYDVFRLLLEAGADLERKKEGAKTVRQMSGILADIDPAIHELFAQY